MFVRFAQNSSLSCSQSALSISMSAMWTSFSTRGFPSPYLSYSAVISSGCSLRSTLCNAFRLNLRLWLMRPFNMTLSCFNISRSCLSVIANFRIFGASSSGEDVAKLTRKFDTTKIFDRNFCHDNHINRKKSCHPLAQSKSALNLLQVIMVYLSGQWKSAAG